ncbi:MAG: decaprenyl-phosphate phosphoribosyltransferase [Deltaproteobacteria bacterium]|nr:decaprenyl-phosphate phosphoribosyltransferase [Deltaproteobacteria bacterium]
MTAIFSIFKLARPAQWVKNIFVFTALIFSGDILKINSVIDALIAFAGFCLVSSAVYFLNDYKDIQSDRQHPVKKNRPLAAGQLPPFTGIAGFIILASVGITIFQSFLGLTSTIILITYLLMNIAYSFGLKNVVILDVLIIAGGFVLRILAGSSAISSMPSTWLILCAITVSLLLGFTKRRAEVTTMGDNAKSHRKVLNHYNRDFLDQAISIATAATVVCYILYTVDPNTIKMAGSKLLIFSVPSVLYGIFRYLYIVYHNKSGGDPARDVFTDIPMLINGIIWALFCTIAILYGPEIVQFLRSVQI